MTQRQQYAAWLNDAYAMEKDIVQVLESHVEQANEYPHVQTKIQEHLEQSRKHAEIVESCLTELDEDVSNVKSALAGMSGNLKGAMSGMMDDRIVKNAIAEAATEKMEIAAYQALIQTAQALGYEKQANKLDSILEEEMQMELWLEDNLPMVVRDYLAKVDQDEE